MEIVLSANARQAAFCISEQTEIAAVRRAASDMAARLRFNAVSIGQVSIMVTEAATNILKHAGRGEILLRPLQDGQRTGIEILAIDAGPGMGSLSTSMIDGNSTAGSYGAGLGAMRRLAAQFDVYSLPGKGTVIGMVLWDSAIVPDGSSMEHGVVCLPMAGETTSGDAWGLHCDSSCATVVVADGLGHGPEAAQASELAVGAMIVMRSKPVPVLMQEAHAALKATRGAAVALLKLDLYKNQLLFAGVGNIAAHVYDSDGGGHRQMVSHNGIVGSNLRKVQEFGTPWVAGALLILHSDGLGTRWNLSDYPGIFSYPPRLIAAILYRDFQRGRDDVTVLVLREVPGSHHG
jgi:anti-sigma regulatory factor (Ser/Thr protein kinase)